MSGAHDEEAWMALKIEVMKWTRKYKSMDGLFQKGLASVLGTNENAVWHAIEELAENGKLPACFIYCPRCGKGYSKWAWFKQHVEKKHHLLVDNSKKKEVKVLGRFTPVTGFFQ